MFESKIGKKEQKKKAWEEKVLSFICKSKWYLEIHIPNHFWIIHFICITLPNLLISFSFLAPRLVRNAQPTEVATKIVVFYIWLGQCASRIHIYNICIKEKERGRGMKGHVCNSFVKASMVICPIGAENLCQWWPQAQAGREQQAWLLFRSMFQHFLSNPIPRLPQGEGAPYAVNHMPPIALLHSQVGLKTAQHTS